MVGPVRTAVQTGPWRALGPFLRPHRCTPSVRLHYACLSASHRQCLLRFFTPQCCSPSVSGPFLRAFILSTVSTAAPLCAPQYCPPPVPAKFLCTPMLFMFFVPHCYPSQCCSIIRASMLSTSASYLFINHTAWSPRAMAGIERKNNDNKQQSRHA